MHTATRGPGRRKHHYGNNLNINEVLSSSEQTPAPSVRLKPPPVQGEDTEDRPITRRDVKLIMPTVLILLFTLVVVLTVIPYAFSSVIKQLHAVQAMEARMAIADNMTEQHQEETSQVPDDIN